MAIVPQTQSFKLYGAGASVGATSITLQSFKNLDGTNLTMTHFGGTKGFLTLEPSLGSQEEQISFASITNNANGTVTLGTIKTVMNYTPFTETAGLLKTHGGNVEVIVSNTSGFYNNIISGATASQIINVPAGFIAATDVQGAINELDTEVLHKAGTETATGIKTFTETAMPRISAAHTYIVGEEEFLTTKRYVDNVAGSAAVANASTTVKGIVEEGTDAEVLSSATTGGTGARLYINPGSVGNVANKIPFVTSTGKLPSSLIPNLKFGGTGADAALNISSSVTNIDLGGLSYVIKNYTSISITGTASVTFTNPHANGTTVVFKSQGDVTITTSATRAIDLRGIGAAGGGGGGNYVGSGGSGGAAGGASVCNSGGNGGAASGVAQPGFGNNSFSLSGVITGGTSNSATSSGIGGVGLGYTTGLPYHVMKALIIAPGSGGSGGLAAFGGANGGNGGNGGGGLSIECFGSFTCSGTIDASGQNGVAGGNGNGGGGGGGSIIALYTTLISNTGTYTIAGGTGGGAGGAGYSYIGLNTEFV